jgi:hypothetical protein
MKMIKRTLIAIAVVALLVTTSHAAITQFNFESGDHAAVKVDGSTNVRWPYTYTALQICKIPIVMKVGMYVQVIDCGKKKLVLEQVPCSDIGKGDDEYPCYRGCVDFDVRANFDVKMGASLTDKSDIIGDWDKDPSYKGEDVVPGDGATHNVKVCVLAWNTKIYKAAPGDEVSVGNLKITVKPNV